MIEQKLEEKIEDIELGLFLEALYRRYGYDFRGYSMASIKRRMLQGLERFQCRNFSQLQEKLLYDSTILTELLGFLTVQVSDLFRDPSYFKAIREQVIPHLRTYPSLKVWVAGCAGGEELYSLAILFREEGLEDRTIFYATDINPEALKEAEAGRYSLDRVPQFTLNHQKSGGKSSLSDYYTAAYGAIVFDKSLRKRTVFSDHSLVTDSVFGEMQFVSCRNVLIYFRTELQNRAIGLFKDSLSRKGFLGLGSKESMRFSPHTDSFIDFCNTERIYQKKGPL